MQLIFIVALQKHYTSHLHEKLEKVKSKRVRHGENIIQQ